MTHRVLVGMSVHEARERDALQRRADDTGASLAFLQHGEPSLVAELDRLAAAGVEHVTLERVALGGTAPARSWLRRVAGHWMRAGVDRPAVVVDERPVTGREAPLTSPAWEAVPGHRQHIFVCRGPRCWARGADEVAESLSAALGEAGLEDDDVLVTQTGCLFPCNHAPVIVVHPDDVWFGSTDPEDVDGIVEAHVRGDVLPARHRLPRRSR